MNPVIPRISLPEVVADELRRRLADGAFKDTLPGVRGLSKVLGVSVPTVCRALHLLEGEGLLDGGGGRRRRRVAAEKPAAEVARNARGGAAKRGGRLLFLSGHALGSERQSGVEVFAAILDLLGPKGWEVTHRVVGFGNTAKPRQAWDEMLRLNRPDALIVLNGTATLAKWASNQGLRTLFLGGESGDSGVPMLAIRTSSMLATALEKLVATGHERILLPMCGRTPTFVNACRKATHAWLIAAKVSPSRLIIAETPYAAPEVMADLIRAYWKKHSPDALISMDCREFVAASCAFKQLRVSIPEDVSVVNLSHNPSMSWHVPAISHFEHPVKQLARTAAKWVMDGKGGRVPSSRETFVEVRANWVEGGSILNRKQARRREPGSR